ncbi:MAG TPA: GyrI-like domain-containing protein [Gammaproteobacteria bacterium]|nr:GyrI-like domain-containing protein [Gammaproteobacteria bacterium]
MKNLKLKPIEPHIVSREPFTVVGLEYKGPMKNMVDIPKLWHLFNDRIQEIENKMAEDRLYGVFYQTPSQRATSEMTYMACVPVSHDQEIPEGMISKEVQGGKFAALTHKGPISDIVQSIDFLHSWILGSEFEFDQRESYELYDNRFQYESADSEFDIFLAIK